MLFERDIDRIPLSYVTLIGTYNQDDWLRALLCTTPCL
jgi:hypothetical protein